MRKSSVLGVLGAAALLLAGCGRYPHPWDEDHESYLGPDVAPSPVDQPAPIVTARPEPDLVGGAELFEPRRKAKVEAGEGSISFPGAKGAVCSCSCEQPPAEENAQGAPEGGAQGAEAKGPPAKATSEPGAGKKQRPRKQGATPKRGAAPTGR
jgi:hypothetical protein